MSFLQLLVGIGCFALGIASLIAPQRTQDALFNLSPGYESSPGFTTFGSFVVRLLSIVWFIAGAVLVSSA